MTGSRKAVDSNNLGYQNGGRSLTDSLDRGDQFGLFVGQLTKGLNEQLF
jgi:hypothetical protein